ncbi:polycystin-1-like protein 2 [Littorina saxatilis]|uniref:polycystin-1-like protein 2 n=1 Tax=Littorina saxatilis TaxID=31220 RepID=UPI0038B60F2F
MVTNAMFYKGKEADREQLRGVELGPLQINYRQVFVGVVSAVIVVVPASLIVLSFKRRKIRGVTSPSIADMTTLPVKKASNKVSAKAYPLATKALSPREVQPEVETLSTKTAPCYDNKAFQPEMEGLECEESFTRNNQDNRGSGTRTGITTPYSTKAREYKSKDLSPAQGGFSKTRGGLNMAQLGRNTPEHASNVNTVSQFLLPWWFIFVGYAIAGLSVVAGAFFTFLYSLEWGGMTSLDWLLAFFFATSTGTFLLEPLKILFISVALSCIFQKLARDEISTVAPFSADRTQTWYLSQRGVSSPMPTPTADPGEAESTKELKQRRQSLVLRRHMYGVLKSLTAQALYVTLLFVICFQSNVRESFLQNEAVRNQMALRKLSTDVTSPSDVTLWLEKHFLQNVLPLTGFDGDVISVTRRRFLSDQSNFRLGPVALTQYRVQGDCDFEDSIQSRLGSVHCVPLYSAESEETRTFSAGWTVCDQNCSDTAFLYDAGDELTIGQESRGEFYGPGGYRVSLDHTRRVAEVTLHRLRTDGWLDRYTRAVNVEMNLFNPNTRLFTQAKVLLQFPSSGSCLPVISLRSARLYPYTTVWDYLLLVLQLVFVVVVIVRLCVVAKSVCFPPQGHGRCCNGAVVTLLELLLSLSAIVIYIVRIDRTILVLERVRNDPDIFTSWDVVFVLDYVYRVCLSVCLFTRVLCLLGPLSFSKSLHVLHETLMRSRPQLYGLALVAALLLTAFAAFFFLFEGPVTYRLRNFLQSYQTLLTVLLTMTKYNALRTDGGDRFQEAFHKVMYGFYCLVAAMMIMNFAITILTVYISDVRKMKSQGASQGDEGDLGQFIWSKLQSLVSPFTGPDRRKSLRAATRDKKTPAKEVDNLEELEAKLEQMLSKLMPLHSGDDPWARAAYEELHRTKNRLREVELEAEQHRTQLSLLRERVGRLSDGVLNVDVSYSVDWTVIRILDADYVLLYVLKLTNKNDTAVVTCTAEEVTKDAEDMDSDAYKLLSKVVKLTFSSEEDFKRVEVGFPVKTGIPHAKQVVAVKRNDQMPWLYFPAMMEDGMLWSRLQGLPLCLAAVVRADQTGQ